MKDEGIAHYYACARQGDSAALDRLVSSCWTEVEAFVRRNAGKEVLRIEAAEDLVSRTLLVFCRRFQTFPERLDAQGLRGVLLQLAKWEIARVLERRPPARRFSSTDSPEPASPTRSSGTVTRADERAHLLTILARMNPRYAEVLRCQILEGKSTPFTALELGISEENVKKRLLRARQELRRLAASWGRSEKEQRPGLQNGGQES